MFFPEYVFTIETGWKPLPLDAHTFALTAEDPDDLSEALYQAGYKRLAESETGRCGVGWFHVWHREDRTAPLERTYAIALMQVGAHGVIWIGTLPALWDFIRLYGSVGPMMRTRHAAEETEEEETDADDLPLCDDCRAALEATGILWQGEIHRPAPDPEAFLWHGKGRPAAPDED
jgi:hypothetical protein